MDSPLSTLGFVIIGVTFSIYSVIAESQTSSTSVSPPYPSPPPPPPYTHPPLPPPRSSPSTAPPRRSHFPRPHHFSPPRNFAHANPSRSRHRLPPPPPSHRMNGGKKIGLLFAGIAGVMQIGVVGFLVFKRRQLLRTKDAFEASA